MRLLIFSFIVIFALTGCAKSMVNTAAQTPAMTSAPVQTPTQTAEAVKQETVKEKPVEVDKGLLNVVITLPASMFKGANLDDVIVKAKTDGVSEATKNADGSLTYKMSKTVYNEMMKKAESGLIKAVEEVKTNKSYTSIKDVTYNKSFSEFTLVVDQKAFESSFDGFAALGLGLSAMYYQMFDGVKPEDYKVKVFLKNVASGEVFKTIIYPDAFNESKK